MGLWSIFGTSKVEVVASENNTGLMSKVQAIATNLSSIKDNHQSSADQIKEINKNLELLIQSIDQMNKRKTESTQSK